MLILIGMRGGIGDIVLYTSVLKAFREKFPQAKLICGTSRTCLELAQTIPYFDEYISDFRPRYIRSRRGRISYKDKRTGFSLPHIDQYYSLNHPYKDLSEEEGNETHIIDLAARILGVSPSSRKGMVFLSEKHRRVADVLHINRPLLVLAPSSAQKVKVPEMRLINKIRAAFEDIGYTCVKILPPGVEIPEIECRTLSFASIMETAAFISRADYYVGLDSGLSHMAASLDIPLSTLHIGYTLERSGVLGSKVNPIFFKSRKIPESRWDSIVSSIVAHALS